LVKNFFYYLNQQLTVHQKSSFSNEMKGSCKPIADIKKEAQKDAFGNYSLIWGFTFITW